MTHRAEPTVALSAAPPTPAEDLAKACADMVLAKFVEAGYPADGVQVIAYRQGFTLATWFTRLRRRA